MQKIPYTIETIMRQAGTGMFGGALPYIGMKGYSFSFSKDKNPDYEERSNYYSKFDENGLFEADVYVKMRPNTKKRCFILVAYEPDDTYSVYLWRAYTANQQSKTGKFGEVLAFVKDVYCDTLNPTIKAVYDNYIEQYQSGLISF